MTAESRNKIVLTTLAVGGVVGLGIVVANDLPRIQAEVARCENGMFGYVCYNRPVAEMHRGEFIINGEKYTLTYNPRVDGDTYIQIEPRKILGITIGGEGDINQAVVDLEARECKFNSKPFGGEKVRKIYVEPGFPDPPSLRGAIGFVQNGECLPVS